MEPGETRLVRVVYALADRQDVVTVNAAAGSTVAQVVELSGLAHRFPEIAATPMQCAIFGRVVPMAQVVDEGDRIEILRPLIIDPKENRRQVAAKSKSPR